MFVFFFLLLLAGLFGGIGIFYRNRGKKPADSKAEERRPLLAELGRSLKSWSVAVCAPVPAAPCTPISVLSHPAGTSQGQVSEGMQLLHQPHLHPCSLSMLFPEDWSPWHHLGGGEPQEGAPHPQTTSNQPAWSLGMCTTSGAAAPAAIWQSQPVAENKATFC